ncbi:hypothetical protein [Rheinheimera sp. NSM]|uniref:hypothetical protein n=1 Tax=Rheinheimera sp. NSM TaxID=3457884 RepID=UPI004036FAB7
MSETSMLAINEFTFRYLYPLSNESKWRALDDIELQSQFAPHYLPGQDTDISSVVCAALSGDGCPQAGFVDRLLYALCRTHLPGYITTDASYGMHAEYPSPRSYYQLQFILACSDGHSLSYQHIDLDNWILRGVEAGDSSIAGEEAGTFLLIKTNFTIYNQLYNRFRYGLFCLELGHCLQALNRNLVAQGLKASLIFDQQQFVIKVVDALGRNSVASVDMSRRTSGFFNYGLFPKKVAPELLALPEIAGIMASYLLDFAAMCPPDFHHRPGLKAIVEHCGDYPCGIYQWCDKAFELEKPGSYMSDFQQTYNYNNFSFIHSSCVLFFTIDTEVLNNNRGTALCNVMLGAFSQRLIEHFTAKGLFARPFRSYDQFKLDNMLHDAETEDRRMTYYGLLIGKNRATQSIGAIK